MTFRIRPARGAIDHIYNRDAFPIDPFAQRITHELRDLDRCADGLFLLHEELLDRGLAVAARAEEKGTLGNRVGALKIAHRGGQNHPVGPQLLQGL